MFRYYRNKLKLYLKVTALAYIYVITDTNIKGLYIFSVKTYLYSVVLFAPRELPQVKPILL